MDVTFTQCSNTKIKMTARTSNVVTVHSFVFKRISLDFIGHFIPIHNFFKITTAFIHFRESSLTKLGIVNI